MARGRRLPLGCRNPGRRHYRGGQGRQAPSWARAVLAVVDGAVTAKILRKRDGKFYLATANSRESFPDIELTEESEIWGVIAGAVRRYDLA